jgi:hypothetical protein
VSARKTLAAVLATAAGLTAVVIDRASDTGEDAIAAGLAGAVTVGFAILLFGWAVPHATAGTKSTTNIALMTSAVGFFSVASAWTGLPFVLGTGGAMLGAAARNGTSEPHRRGIGTFAIALGVGAVALGCAAAARVR